MIDANKLADLIEAATERVKICVPSQSYYALRNDWSEEEIEVIHASQLVQLLRDSTSEQH